jgi:hypothetical protein
MAIKTSLPVVLESFFPGREHAMWIMAGQTGERAFAL